MRNLILLDLCRAPSPRTSILGAARLLPAPMAWRLSEDDDAYERPLDPAIVMRSAHVPVVHRRPAERQGARTRMLTGHPPLIALDAHGRDLCDLRFSERRNSNQNGDAKNLRLSAFRVLVWVVWGESPSWGSQVGKPNLGTPSWENEKMSDRNLCGPYCRPSPSWESGGERTPSEAQDGNPKAGK